MVTLEQVLVRAKEINAALDALSIQAKKLRAAKPPQPFSVAALEEQIASLQIEAGVLAWVAWS